MFEELAAVCVFECLEVEKADNNLKKWVYSHSLLTIDFLTL